MAPARIESIYDLAKQTGLSTSTISRVLNQRGRISMRTRQRVLAAAREAGFKPRMSARQTVVAVVVDRMRYATYGGFAASLLTHLVDEFSRHDVAVEVYTESNVARLGSRFIDGVVALSWDDATVAQLRALRDVPIVVLNRMELEGFSHVATDHAQGGRMVAEYLLKRGHERIAFLTEERDWGAQQRLEGMRSALDAAGLTLDDQLVGFTEHEPLYGILRRLLHQKPTALFLAGEDLALEGTFLLTDLLQVSIPSQLSVVGIENQKVSQFTRPPLTTLRQPLDILAAEALRLVTAQIEGKRTIEEQVVLENEMIERESVGQRE